MLDTNLLILQVTSLVDIDLFPSFKRVRIFAREDVPLLRWLLSQFRSVATNAYVLAEASNLANELSGLNRRLWFEALARFASATGETHVATAAVAGGNMLVPFGMTDAALGALPETHVVITAERKLSGYLEDQGRAILNFNHIRSL